LRPIDLVGIASNTALDLELPGCVTLQPVSFNFAEFPLRPTIMRFGEIAYPKSY
jgi:hypothetical protein